MTVTIHTGDCREVLRTLPAQSVHTCITSPPYFGLRDYGVDGQIGLEDVADCLGWATGARCGACFVCVLVDVFREVRRVLRDDGTCWLNLGDSYASSGGQSPQSGRLFKGRKRQHENICISARSNHADVAPKNLRGMPWRVALALQADGWYLRQDIIWAKPNPMPESVRDRCTKAHEYLFLLSKSPRYYFDVDAIAETSVGGSALPVPSGWDTGAGSHRELTGRYQRPSKPKGSFAGKTGDKAFRKTGETRNKRSVWTIPTKPYKEAHFATFPPALVEPCVLAGCPVGGRVLDPFGGSGTTSEVAERLGRDSVLIELSPEYVALERRRTRQGSLQLAVETLPRVGAV